MLFYGSGSKKIVIMQVLGLEWVDRQFQVRSLNPNPDYVIKLDKDVLVNPFILEDYIMSFTGKYWTKDEVRLHSF